MTGANQRGEQKGTRNATKNETELERARLVVEKERKTFPRRKGNTEIERPGVIPCQALARHPMCPPETAKPLLASPPCHVFLNFGMEEGAGYEDVQEKKRTRKMARKRAKKRAHK